MSPTTARGRRLKRRDEVALLRAKGLSVRDIASRLGVPKTTLYGWRHRGTGPTAIPVGRHLRYRMSDVEKWLDEQSRG